MSNKLAAVSGTRAYFHNFPATALHTTSMLKVHSTGTQTIHPVVKAADIMGCMPPVADVAANSCVPDAWPDRLGFIRASCRGTYGLGSTQNCS
jgi:hypothetical protein